MTSENIRCSGAKKSASGPAGAADEKRLPEAFPGYLLCGEYNLQFRLSDFLKMQACFEKLGKKGLSTVIRGILY
jgi:hypothetical protein